jgi:hypothetical protein
MLSYKLLGRKRLCVSEFCLGGMTALAVKLSADALAYGDTHGLIEPTASGDGRPAWAERGGDASMAR